jgi:signal transduction histidine kinase/ligand-binding sensor domain-containing protein/DNA-binding response OmpR family regulator
MILKKSIQLLLCAIGLTFRGAAQEDINFTALTTKNGLSSNTVNAILKDRFGLIWFGTDDGLDKFDGTNFKVYRHKPGDSTSLQANEILALHEDKAGNLWIGTSGGSLSLYDRKKDAFVNFPAGRNPNSLKNNVIKAVCSDYRGHIWVIHYAGFDVLDPRTRSIIKIPLTTEVEQSIKTGHGHFAFEDSKQRMWVGLSNGLLQYDPATMIMKQFRYSSRDSSGLADSSINAIAEDKQGNIWIGTRNGLSLYKPGTGQFINYGKSVDKGKTFSSTIINSIAVEADKLWLGTESGLYILNTNTGEARKFGFDHRNSHSLSAQAVRSLYLDNQGICWLGMFGGGVSKFDRNLNLFNSVTSNVFDEKGLRTSYITSFAEDNSGNVFVGTGGGLSVFNPKTRLFESFDIKPVTGNPRNYLSILCLKQNKRNRLMIGTFGNGLFVLDPVTKNYQQIVRGDNPGDLNSNDIFCIEEDRKGNTWIGTNGDGINVLNSENKVVARYTPRPKHPNDIKVSFNEFIRDIEEDGNGNLWIATHGGGIAVFLPSSGKFVLYNTGNSQLPNDKVLSLLEDKLGNIWAGTFGGGLVMFQKQTNQIVSFTEKDGLLNSTIYKILEDQNGLIWVSTNKGISSIDPRTNKINNYTHHNGVQNNNFINGSGIRLSTGELFFGGLEGFNYFNPLQLRRNNNIPSVLITDLRISNQSVSASEDGPIQEHISVAKEINLDYKQNFALSFVGLDYTSPEQNQYAYKLEGFDKEWNYVGNTNHVSYTNLDPGEYLFRVRASNNDGVWSNEEASVQIFVHPPFWLSTYAYILYVCILAGLLLYFRYRSIRKIKRKLALEQVKVRAEQDRREAERVHELDMLKIKFLTNLSHEFRTPISLILGPAEKLLSQQKNEQSSGQLQMIKRNAKRLLNLVNQLLDFRKMEEQELKLQASEGELVSFIQETCDSFTDLSEKKKISFEFKTHIRQLNTRFDHDKMERILFNLLSNAFKFTHEGGKISLELAESDKISEPPVKWVLLKVADSGIGIPADKKEIIFERFFQNSTSASILNQGSGIGLSITKEFVKMHGGEIEVDSELEKGTTFNIHLPFIPLHLPEINEKEQTGTPEPAIETELIENAAEEETAKVNAFNNNLAMPVILLVEDNEDFRFYLKDNLRLHYKIVEAGNGKEAWHKILAHHPQLVVSDISMPDMDGIQLTEKIKSDKRTSHIPVILLTALTGEKDQITGLRTGANDYITKPFDSEVLNAKIKNLLALKNTLKNTYSRQIKVLTPEVKIESENEKLLQEIMLYLEENLTNPKLSVEELSKHVGMSRSSLYNKILELTGETPVEFIRSVKLNKAAILLEKGEKNVAQIAYSVGFSTPNYFAKSFKAKFNMLPTEYINKMRKKGQITQE